MNNEFFDTVKQTVKYWWVSLLLGIFAIILGIACMFMPGSALIALSILFVVGFVVGGLLEIIYAISNKDSIKGWGWTLASGIISLIFGILLLATPIGTMGVMLFFVGFWIMFQSFWSIGTSIDLSTAGVKGWGWVLAFGILGLILSFILITNPVFTAGFVVYLLAFTLIFYGIVRIYYSIRMKSFYNKIKG